MGKIAQKTLRNSIASSADHFVNIHKIRFLFE